MPTFARFMSTKWTNAFWDFQTTYEQVRFISARPHAHQTQREKRSKLGCQKPIVATELFTLQAASNAPSNKRRNGTWLNFFALCCALLPVWMRPKGRAPPTVRHVTMSCRVWGVSPVGGHLWGGPPQRRRVHDSSRPS